MKVYDVEVAWGDDRKWLIAIPKINRTTSASQFTQIKETAHACVVVATCGQPDEIDVNITAITVPKLGDIASTLEDIAADRADISFLPRAGDLALQLLDAGVPLRDIADQLNVSRAWVLQIGRSSTGRQGVPLELPDGGEADPGWAQVIDLSSRRTHLDPLLELPADERAQHKGRTINEVLQVLGIDSAVAQRITAWSFSPEYQQFRDSYNVSSMADIREHLVLHGFVDDPQAPVLDVMELISSEMVRRSLQALADEPARSRDGRRLAVMADDHGDYTYLGSMLAVSETAQNTLFARCPNAPKGSGYQLLLVEADEVTVADRKSITDVRAARLLLTGANLFTAGTVLKDSGISGLLNHFRVNPLS